MTKMKKKSLLLIICLFAILSCGCSTEAGKLESKLSNQKTTESINLKKVTDFKWDTVFFVSPYMTKKEIEETISINSDNIEDNNFDDSEIYILFANNGEIVYTILGRPDNLGFDFDVGSYDKVKEIPADKAKFSISKGDNLLMYNYK